MDAHHLPSNQVINEARLYRKAALLLERNAEANTDMYWPAAMNAALAVELYLKSFLVEKEIPAVSLTKKGRDARHDLSKLFAAIPGPFKNGIEEVNRSLAPPLDLSRLLATYADYFPKVRYSYEKGSKGVIRSELFDLMNRMEQICAELQPKVVPWKP